MNNNLNDYAAILKNREAMYRLLGRLYLKEVDEDVLGKLRALQLPQGTGCKALDDGYALLAAALAAPSKDPLTDLAVDYARIFLGAGIVDETVAYPYESVYTSPGKLVGQDACENMVKLMRREGLAKADKDLFEDQLGLEFAYMAHMIGKSLAALEAGHEEELSDLLDEQAEFVGKHLLNWVPRMMEDVRKCPGGDFYRAVSLITDGFLELEKDLFAPE